MANQRYTVTDYHRSHTVGRSGDTYRDYGPHGADFLYVALEKRGKGQRKWHRSDLYSVMANQGRIVSIHLVPFERDRSNDVEEGSDKWVAISAEITKFYTDTKEGQ